MWGTASQALALPSVIGAWNPGSWASEAWSGWGVLCKGGHGMPSSMFPCPLGPHALRGAWLQEGYVKVRVQDSQSLRSMGNTAHKSPEDLLQNEIPTFCFQIF